jgi:hypothetical protein
MVAPAILTLGIMRQEDCNFEGSLDYLTRLSYITRPWLNQTNTITTKKKYSTPTECIH